MSEQSTTTWRTALSRAALAVPIIAAGFGLMYLFQSMKATAIPVPPSEPVLETAIVVAMQEDVPVMVTGYGTVRSRDTAAIAPKVAGEVIEVHPQLEAGGLVRKDEVLFRIDPVDYEARAVQAEAQTAQLESALALLNEKSAQDRNRLTTLERGRDLARQEFERDKSLLENDRIGSQSMVDMSERAYLQAEDAYTQASQAVGLYPLRIAEAQKSLEAARAQLGLAQLSLERTLVRAPFDGRVKSVQLAVGQSVAPGVPAVVLSDDSVLEISVPLDSRDAQSWLRFQPDSEDTAPGWFAAPEPVRCTIVWTEDRAAAPWEGLLSRIERFDPLTRTLTVAVTVDGSAARAAGGLPLTEGMFCEVTIPGKTMTDVFRLPRWAVSFEGEVFVAENDASGQARLQRKQAEVLRTQDEEVFVSGGLAAGDRVVATRLANPMRNALLRIVSETPSTTYRPGAAQ